MAAEGAGMPGVLPELDEQQFAQWTGLVEQRTGMVISAARRSFLSTSLRLRMWELGCRDYQAYYDRVLGPDGGDEWAVLVDRLTVHETRFFRHQNSFRLVEELCRSMPKSQWPRDGLFRAWSVGCATGEEAYSIAMVLDDVCRQRDCESRFVVAGTDISLPALRTAQRGRYEIRRWTGIQAPMQKRYCTLYGERYFEIGATLRSRLCFAQYNVLEAERIPFRKLDLIYCQNLLIYAEPQQRLDIMKGLAERLAPGGVLVLGPGELPSWSCAGMERIQFEDVMAYRRVSASAAKEIQ